MNTPHVVALHYTVEHRSSVHYQNASHLSHETSEFHLTLEDNSARFELKKHYADEDEARKAVESFIQHWEFEAGLRSGPRNFKLRYRDAEIRNRKTVTHVLRNITASAKITVSRQYPSPPSESAIDLNDPNVVKMYHRYEKYRLGREPLPSMAFFCLTVLENKYQTRRNAAKICRIDIAVFHEIGELTETKGGDEARKAKGSGEDLTRLERRFLKKAIVECISRAAQVVADENQCLPKISLSDLPTLST